MSLLHVRNLKVEFRTDTQIVRAVRDVSFTLDRGERVALVGESGSGKTTTALALMQMIEPVTGVSGTALLDGVDLLALRGEAARLARLSTIAYIPQGAMNSLNPVLSVSEQILDGLHDHGVKLDKEAEKATVATALEGVGLSPEVADMYPHQLSGGMKQRVCIAISTAMEPQLIIADEPTSALDVISQKQVIETLVATQQRIGCGLILIGHDMGLMAQATHRVIVMKAGRIVEDAAVGTIFSQPADAYSRMLIESVPRLGNRIVSGPLPLTGEGGDLIRFENVSKQFRGGWSGKSTTALEPCSFSIKADRSQIIAIVGQSGSGKTTLARMILGLEQPTAGAVQVRGMDLSRLRGAQKRAFRKDVQAIFQDPYGSFNPFYKADRALAAPARRFGLVGSKADLYRQMEAACAAVGLDAGEVLGRFPHELSGGQRQRLMVARALMLRPRLIVADEPVSMVDASLRMTILRNLEDLKRQHGISVIYITHDLATAYHISDYALVLHKGRIVEAGAPDAVIENPSHPYTRSLVAAIPWPDPRKPWLGVSDADSNWSAPPAVRGQVEGVRFGPSAHDPQGAARPRGARSGQVSPF